MAVNTQASGLGPASLGSFSSLELRHLLALDAVATEGTFGRAAERLGYTQGAVSQQIAALERAIGGSVFDRPGGPRPVRITPLGKVMLAHAREILAKAQATAESIERFKAGESGRVDLGTFQSVSNVVLPRIVRRLRDEHPAVDIRVFEEESAIERLQAGELDLAFWAGPVDGTDHVELFDDPYVLVARRGEYPEGPVHIKRLDGVQMVAFPPALCDSGRVEASIAAAGVNPVVVFRTQDNGAMVSMVRAGMGSAIMPSLAIDIKPGDADLCTHQIKPRIPPRKIIAMWQSNRTLSPLAQRVIDLAVEVADDFRDASGDGRVA